METYLETLKVKEGDKDKSSKLMSFRIDDGKLLAKYKVIWTKVENLKRTELNALPVYDDKYIKSIIGTYGDKIYINLRDLNVAEDDIEYESFIIIPCDSLLIYKRQFYLDNCAFKIVNKLMANYLDEMLLKIRYYKCCFTIELI